MLQRAVCVCVCLSKTDQMKKWLDLKTLRGHGRFSFIIRETTPPQAPGDLCACVRMCVCVKLTMGFRRNIIVCKWFSRAMMKKRYGAKCVHVSKRSTYNMLTRSQIQRMRHISHPAHLLNHDRSKGSITLLLLLASGRMLGQPFI